MKVWHLISNRWNSAISEYALSAARALRSAGAESLITPLQASPIETRFLAQQFNVQSIDKFGPTRYPKLASLAANFRPNYIFAYGGPEATAAIFAKRGGKLIRFFGQRVDERGAARALASRFGHLHVDRAIAPSNFVAIPLKNLLQSDVAVVPLGCDEEKYFLVESPRGNRPEILIFGRLDPVKGHREFLPVFKQIIRLSEAHKEPTPLLRIVGLPANLSPVHLWAEADKLEISRQHLEIQCEAVENVAQLMSTSTVGLVSSIGSEVICRVAEEFLLCGTPVVTTSVGSLPEVFTHPSFGESYNHEDIEGAAIKIYARIRLAYKETRIDRLKRAEFAKKIFSLNRMSQELLQLLGAIA